jgi:hypothetical protein
MSSEERQREIREAGSRPAEAEKEAGADEGRKRLSREEASREAGPDSPDEPTPAAEDDEDKHRPRR